MKLVGLQGNPAVTVVRDDVDVVTEMGSSPKLTDRLLGCCVNFTDTAIQVDNPGDIGSVEAAIAPPPRRGPTYVWRSGYRQHRQGSGQLSTDP